MQLPRGVQRERLVIVVDVVGPAGAGKTAACAEIIRAVRSACGPRLPDNVISNDYKVLSERLIHPIPSDHTKINFALEVFHHGA